MAKAKYYIGQRLSLRTSLCTVRYIGPVDGKQGKWLGVEWDDTFRGKNDGLFDGKRYFSCASNASTAASFLRPDQPWDETRTLGEAIRDKYISHEHELEADIVYVSGKQAEEVGFSKFAKRQAALHGINTLVLDRMRIRGSDLTDVELDVQHVTDLDLSCNLFEFFTEILDIWKSFPRLQSLSLEGNRSSIDSEAKVDPNFTLRRLDLSNTLLPWQDVCSIREQYGSSIRRLNLSRNEYALASALPLCDGTLEMVDLSENDFASLDELDGLCSTQSLRTIILKHNRINIVSSPTPTSAIFNHILELDLSRNQIDSLKFFDDLARRFPRLKHLRSAANPVYDNLVSADGKSLTSEDGYMLTIARLPSLETLNYSKITEKERLNAEMYYLNQIAIELGNADPAAKGEKLKRHPRYQDLCEEYGEPDIGQYAVKQALDPNSLVAKLCTCTFFLSDGTLPGVTSRSWSLAVPKSFTIYALLGLVGKRLDLMPLKLRMTLETAEQDPVGTEGTHGAPEWWDSDDEVEDADTSSQWKIREVPLVAGTRLLGTYVEGKEARIRIDDVEEKVKN